MESYFTLAAQYRTQSEPAYVRLSALLSLSLSHISIPVFISSVLTFLLLLLL